MFLESFFLKLLRLGLQRVLCSPTFHYFQFYWVLERTYFWFPNQAKFYTIKNSHQAFHQNWFVTNILGSSFLVKAFPWLSSIKNARILLKIAKFKIESMQSALKKNGGNSFSDFSLETMQILPDCKKRKIRKIGREGYENLSKVIFLEHYPVSL